MSKRSNLMTRILVAASFVVVAAFAGFSVYIDSLQHDTTTRAVEDNISSSGKQAAQSVANWLNGRVTLTAMVADAAGAVAGQAGLEATLNNDVLVKEFISTYVGDETGKFTTWPVMPMPEGYDPRKRPWYQDAVKAGGSVLTDPYIDASSGDLIISAAAPVMKDGKLAGVAGSDFSLKTLVSMVKDIDVGGEGFAFLVNKSGQILVHPDAKLVTKTLTDAFPVSTPSIGSAIVETELEGKPMLVSFVPVAGLPTVEWYVGFAVDADLAYSAIGQFRIAATIATLLAVGMMIAFLATLLSRLVIRPVTDMTGAMERLAAGDLKAEIPGQERRDQIGSMAAAVAVFRTNAIERARLEGEAESGRSLSEQERREREALKARETADIQQAVEALATGLGRLADGDLGYRISVPFVTHLDRLRADFNNSVTKLHQTLQAVGTNARAIDAGATEIRTAADDLARRTEQQAASVEETAAALGADHHHRPGQRPPRRRSRPAGCPHTCWCRKIRRGRAQCRQCHAGYRKVVRRNLQHHRRHRRHRLPDQLAGAECRRRGGPRGRCRQGLCRRCPGSARTRPALGQCRQGDQGADHHIRPAGPRRGDPRRRNRPVAAGDRVGGAGDQHAYQRHRHLHPRTIDRTAEINTAVNTMDQGTQQNAAMVEEQTAASHGLASEAAALNDLLAQFNIGGTQQAAARQPAYGRRAA